MCFGEGVSVCRVSASVHENNPKKIRLEPNVLNNNSYLHCIFLLNFSNAKEHRKLFGKTPQFE
jgi:hypothetical protein